MLLRIAVLACVVVLPPVARAQNPPPPNPPPCAILPPPGEADWLEAAGRHKKRVGAILMATGSTLMVVGTALSIAGFWDHDQRCISYYYGPSNGWCHDSALTLAGATTTIVGVGALVPGIIEHVRGANEVDEAARLRRCLDGCVRPSLFPGGGGVQLELRH